MWESLTKDPTVVAFKDFIAARKIMNCFLFFYIHTATQCFSKTLAIRTGILDWENIIFNTIIYTPAIDGIAKIPVCA